MNPTTLIESPSPIVTDCEGYQKQLGSIMARGGEGIVYEMTDRADVIVKIYHDEVLSDPHRSAHLQKKITQMSENEILNQHPQLAWPMVPLFLDSNKQWCGYAMYRRSGISLRELCGNPFNFAQSAPTWHRQHLVRLCLDFLDTIETVARAGAIPLDFNPSNFIVNLTKGRIFFIDCDSYQFIGSSGHHLAGAIMPELAAPEVMRRNSPTAQMVGSESLRFSIGMILFYILNLGNSPYRHINGLDPVSNLLEGNCALGRGADCRFPRGKAYLIWSHLIFDLKNLFIRCFRDGHSNPAARPTNAEWRDALIKYNQCLRSGYSDASIIPSSPKKSE